MTLSVRPLEPSDFQEIVNYWTNASPEDLERMGADPAKLPSPRKFEESLKTIHQTPLTETRTYYMIWLVDGEAIGFSSLKNISFPQSGEIHLHMWDAASRGKGYGPILFCLSAIEFYQRFQLQRIQCEPRTSNPYPNRMFQKLGFPLVKTHVAASSELSLTCELNQYEIRRDLAEQFLSRSLQK